VRANQLDAPFYLLGVAHYHDTQSLVRWLENRRCSMREKPPFLAEDFTAGGLPFEGF